MHSHHLIYNYTYILITLYINRLYINLYINFYIFHNLYIKKQHVFLLRNDDFHSICTFQIKSSLI